MMVEVFHVYPVVKSLLRCDQVFAELTESVRRGYPVKFGSHSEVGS